MRAARCWSADRSFVDELRATFIAGTAVDYAREFAPPAFAVAVNDKIAQEYAAAAALSGLFDLFEDDDVLRLFDMREPQ